MSIHADGWAVIGASTTAIISVLSTLYIARKNNKQVIDQAKDSLEQAAASLNVQRISTGRVASTFVAEKRQKWIDDLRDDVAQCIALSHEIVDGWKRVVDAISAEWDKQPPYTQDQLDYYTNLAVNNSASIAERSSLHTQLVTRIAMRLNMLEHAHRELNNALYSVRAGLRVIAQNASYSKYDNRDIYDSIDQQLQVAQIYAQAILKEEWRKLKREVADPDRLIESILATSPPDDAEVKAFVKETAPSVPSTVLIDIPSPKRHPSAAPTSQD